jgi:hypothetical protein
MFLLMLLTSMILATPFAFAQTKSNGAGKGAGAGLAADFRKAMQNEKQIDQDIATLLNRLDKDEAFSKRLEQSMEKGDAATATKLIQGISVSTVTVGMEAPKKPRKGKPGGHVCWYRNGVRKCLWYSGK